MFAVCCVSSCPCDELITRPEEFYRVVKKKGKALPLQARSGSYGSRRLRIPEFLYNRHMKVV